MKHYKCVAYGSCDRADSRQTIELEIGASPKCPTCQSPLQAIEGAPSGGSGGGNTKVFGALAVAGIVALSVIGYVVYSKRQPEQVAAVENTAGGASPVAVIQAGQGSNVAPATAQGIQPDGATIKAAKVEGDQSLARGDAGGAEASSNRAIANELIKSAVAKMAQGKLEEAEKDLSTAKDRDAKNYLVYYNLAVIKLRQNQMDEALKLFEASFMLDFKRFDLMEQDKDLDKLRAEPRFQQLVAKYNPSKK